MSEKARHFVDKLHPELRGDVGLLLLVVGGLLAFWFLSYEVSMLKRPHERRCLPQFLVAMMSSALLGFGGFLLLVWAGLYV
mmetsp:Transcript_31326/g.80985  ORF Transcript_31326/g.80985 Transcript_31326/m.80985 type:complete len:81 (-) Transcript_31326:177-419(-)